ncbi:MAG: DegT/DnrJ/EryC1/StrS family aminotransferase [Deltaproteobacteria bacterium]|nr:MAG: DegT/DnrJ/EryC1/StrS family aminotransferase [Deltaproteobacteria bacterium]
MREKLAILGGEKTRGTPFPPHPIIGEEEKRAVMEVLNKGRLSTFIAAPGEDFLGGEKVRELERRFLEYHDTEYAVVFNSATAALHAAVIACGVQPGEEIITTPYTFTSTATCALMANAVPVFVDVKPDTFNIDPVEIEKNISPLTKAIIPVHLFGNPADMIEIMEIAKENNLKVIEDCAQAPGAKYQNKLVGTMGDCGIFSLTENKNITSGEGGVLITNNKEIAEIARLIRNHGEAVIAGQKKRTYKSSILGWNYRMTEVDAAIGIEQFKKLDYFNKERNKLASYLTKKLKEIEGLLPPKVSQENYHVYYVYAILYDKRKIGISRDLFVNALNAEGIPFGAGYVKPLYYSPLYHENKPFIYRYYKGNAKYSPGLCPIAEKLHNEDLITTMLTRPPATFEDMDDIIKAIKKILDNIGELEEYEKEHK